MAPHQFQLLRDHLDSGFRILKYERKFGTYLFSIWEFGQPFIISVEENTEVNAFIETGEYRKYLLEEVMRCLVLFDIVGFSKLENQQQLQKIIRLQCFLNDPKLRDYDIAEKVALGDGAIISFSEANKLKALDYVRDLVGLMNTYNENCKSPERQVHLRIGLNYGMVHRFTDINRVANIIGDGINRCERIASLGVANQVLCSDTVYEMHMENKSRFLDCFLDCGMYADKHGIEFKVFNITGRVEKVEIGISKPPPKNKP